MFPVEVLTPIFCFVGPSSWANPYPYLPLAGVCRHWRDIVLNEPRFWSVLNMGKDLDCDLNKEVIHRSNSRGLDIIMYDSEKDKEKRLEKPTPYAYHGQDVLCRFENFAASDHPLRARIRSLFFSKDATSFKFDYGKPHKFAFPRLERIVGLVDKSNYIVMKNLIATCHLRYAELPWIALLNLHTQKLLHHLSCIEWLKLELPLLRRSTGPILRDILEDLPNVPILILSQPRGLELDSITAGTIDEVSQTIIFLPRLRILSLDLYIRESWTIHAPNLDYLCILCLGEKHFHDSDLLGRINFSEISNILIATHAHTADNYSRHSLQAYSAVDSVVCISGSDRLQIDCLPFEKFHREGLASRAAVDDYLDLPPKNCFHFASPWADFQTFDMILKQAINLVELTLNYGTTKADPEFSSFLVKILDGVDTKITRLNITHGRSFVEACTLLANSAPRLERFMYHNASMIRNTTFLPGRLKALQDARRDAGSSPLKILELRNFVDIPSERVQKIEASGIRLIHK